MRLQRVSRRIWKIFERESIAAVFDAFFTTYVRKTRDLMRIARAGGASLGPDDLHPDLANRLAKEAAKINAAVVEAVRAKKTTKDVGGAMGTREVGEWIAKELSH